MDPTENVTLAPGDEYQALCARIIRLYEDVLRSDHPGAEQFRMKLLNSYSIALRDVRRHKLMLKQAAKKAPVKAGKK